MKNYLFCGTDTQQVDHLGKIIHFPMIEIKPIIFSEHQRIHILKHWEQSTTVIFTSKYATQYFCDFINTYADINDFVNKNICVIGKITGQSFQAYSGLIPNLMAENESSEGLIAALKPFENVLHGSQVLFPRSALPNPHIQKTLIQQFNAGVESIAFYENIKPKKRALPDGPVDGIIFSSPSTINNFIKDYEKIPSDWVILVKGERTLNCLNEHGYQGKIYYTNEKK